MLAKAVRIDHGGREWRMEKPSYRIATLCPMGMSDRLKQYLAGPAGNDPAADLTNRDLIALELLKPFDDSTLPFCCTLLGWAQPKYEPKVLGHVASSISDLTVSRSEQRVSAEGNRYDFERGATQLFAVYPLLDIGPAERTTEYETISLLHNKQRYDQMLSHSYELLLAGALETDEFGIVPAVLAESESLADSKVREGMALIVRALGG
jgi:hypothetical protein